MLDFILLGQLSDMTTYRSKSTSRRNVNSLFSPRYARVSIILNL
jgi:hypothetical protein